MDDVKRKVLLDLFASPTTLFPVAGGLTLLMASWAMGGNGLFNFAGVAAILGGLGLFATRLIFGLEQITDRAYQYVVQQQQVGQEEALEQLHKKLEGDQDPRTQECLRQLRQLYANLKQDIRDGKLAASSHAVLEGVHRLFQVCVDYLGQSHQLWETSRRLAGNAREGTLERREEIVQEIEDSVKHLGEMIARLHSVGGRRKKSELAQLRAELDETISAARRAEQRMEQWTEESKSYDPSEFEPP